MEHKKYMDIERLKVNFADAFEKGDYVVIQEKIDGANASWQYDEETDSIQAFSRKQTLDFKNNLRGFYEFTQKLDKEEYKECKNLRVFCEWLVAHSVPYPKERYQNAYVYDLWDTDNQKYLPQDDVKEFCKVHNLIYVPVFYEGEFQSWDHVRELVGKTELGGEYGEGVVVKNISKLNNPNTRYPFYTKIVGEAFVETKGHSIKQVNPDEIAERQRLQELTESIVTEARVIKLLHKLVDEGIVPEDWDEKSMGIIAKNLPSAVYKDCVKEENETVQIIGENFGKFASSLAMKIVKNELNRR
jgi:ATP-dependent RNA circularization protein (DNA/RNA ligase family)